MFDLEWESCTNERRCGATTFHREYARSAVEHGALEVNQALGSQIIVTSAFACGVRLSVNW